MGGAYTTSSQEFDALVRDVQPAWRAASRWSRSFSAGNSGSGGNTIGAPGTAKNVITVGASENVRPIGATDGCGVTDAGANSARDVIDFSSRGPTDDARIKPDIVAPGTHVTGAQPQTGPEFNGSGTCNPQFPAGSSRYTLVSGTSQAAPEVTGFAALLREWFQRTIGGGTRAPSPAHDQGADGQHRLRHRRRPGRRRRHERRRPDADPGLGPHNLGKLLDGTLRQSVDQSRSWPTAAARTTYYNVQIAARPPKVTLAWSDAVGPTRAIRSSTTSTSRYRGRPATRATSSTAAGPRRGHRRLAQQRGERLPARGRGGRRIKVRVVGTNIAGDGIPGNADTTDQDYALVVSNVGAPQTSRGVLAAGLRTITKGGDGDAYVEPGEPFTVGQNLRNDGNATVTGISGTMSGTGVNVTTGSATWPNLAPNVFAPNTPKFGATVTAPAARVGAHDRRRLECRSVRAAVHGADGAAGDDRDHPHRHRRAEGHPGRRYRPA